MCPTREKKPSDPPLQAVKLIRYEDHPTQGRTAAIRSTIRVDEAYAPLRAPSSPRGAQTRDVLKEIGYSEEAILALLAKEAALSWEQAAT